MRLVTAGMYDEPLALYREYLQNSADAVAEAGCNGSVRIHIDARNFRVRIRDEGPGLSPEEAVERLIPIAQSTKCRSRDRGFRGIGRLVGLAFGEAVSFTTQSSGSESATRVNWDACRLRESYGGGGDGRIRECITVESLPREEDARHFFEVEVRGIARHAAGSVLNRDKVRQYIGEICPVPLSSDFPFSPQVQRLVGPDLFGLNVTIDGDDVPITRPYGTGVRFADDREDPFREIRTFELPAVDARRAAAGWVAHTSYLGTVPKGAAIRGIRARAGNIQVGTENVFAHLFNEERFNRWAVGEVHVLDPRIVPNGRRDYFEPGPHVRNLENHLGAIFRRLSARCRTTSVTRARERRYVRSLEELEDAYRLAKSGYLAAPNAWVMIREARVKLREICEVTEEAYGGNTEIGRRIEALQWELEHFKARRGRPRLGNVQGREISTYRKVFSSVARAAHTPRMARRIIEDVIAQNS